MWSFDGTRQRRQYFLEAGSGLHLPWTRTAGDRENEEPCRPSIIISWFTHSGKRQSLICHKRFIPPLREKPVQNRAQRYSSALCLVCAIKISKSPRQAECMQDSRGEPHSLRSMIQRTQRMMMTPPESRVRVYVCSGNKFSSACRSNARE